MHYKEDSIFLRYLKLVTVNCIFLFITYLNYPLRINSAREVEGNSYLLILPAVLTYFIIKAPVKEKYFYSFLSFLISTVLTYSLFDIYNILNFLPLLLFSFLIFASIKTLQPVSQKIEIDPLKTKALKIVVVVIISWIINAAVFYLINDKTGGIIFVAPYIYLLITLFSCIVSLIWIKETPIGKILCAFITLPVAIVLTILLLFLFG